MERDDVGLESDLKEQIVLKRNEKYEKAEERYP